MKMMIMMMAKWYGRKYWKLDMEGRIKKVQEARGGEKQTKVFNWKLYYHVGPGSALYQVLMKIVF